MEVTRDCLFIGVGIQPAYVRSAPEPGATLGRINTLRRRIAASGAASLQLFMAPTLERQDGLDDAAQAMVRAEVEREFAPCCAPLPDEQSFLKMGERPDDPICEIALSRLRPQQLLVYGYYLDVCGSAVARHAEAVLVDFGRKPEVTMLADCGQCYPLDLRDWQREKPVPRDAAGKPYTLVSSDQLRFPHELALPVQVRRVRARNTFSPA